MVHLGTEGFVSHAKTALQDEPLQEALQLLVNNFAPRRVQAMAALASGGMVIMVDDEDRENEGDLVIAAEKVTPQAINFMAREGRGLICLTLTEEHAERRAGDGVA